MSPPGSTDPEEKSSPDKPDEERESHLDPSFQPENSDQNRMDNYIRSESTIPNHPFTRTFAGRDPSIPDDSITSTGMGHTPLGIVRNTARNVRNDELTRHDPSSELQRTGVNFETRGFSAGNPVRSLSSSALLDDGSFEIEENYNSLAATFELHPLIGDNEPTTDLPRTYSFEGTNDPLTYPQHAHHHDNDVGEGTVSAIIPNQYERNFLFNLYAHGFCAPQRHDENMDRKPAAMDPVLFQQQQQLHHFPHFPHQAYNYPTQAANNPSSFNPTLDRSPQHQGTIDTQMNNRKPPPVASLSRQSDRASQGKGTAETKASNLEAPPIASLPGQGNRRSNRRAPQTKKSKKKPKANARKASPKGAKFTRSKTRIGPKIKIATGKKSSSVSSREHPIQPTSTQLAEARTPRKLEALQTWFQRLQDLIEYKDAHGHSKF